MSQSAHLRKPPSSWELVCDDGEPMESARHRDQMLLLIDSLELALGDRDDLYVGGNMFLYFSEAQSRRNDFRGPDVFVVLGTSRRERRAWVVWEEDGKAPDVVIELLSESTEHVDRGEKMHLYARTLHVAEYFLFDPFSGVLEGYELDAVHGSYLQKKPDVEGRVTCEQLGLCLGRVSTTHRDVHAEWLRWIRPTGEVLPTSQELASAAVSRADAETARADTETARAETEAARAEAETARADAETARADAEAARADRLAAELAELRARAKRL
jgi:Uma2 family endonuclease